MYDPVRASVTRKNLKVSFMGHLVCRKGHYRRAFMAYTVIFSEACVEADMFVVIRFVLHVHLFSILDSYPFW